MKAVFSYRPLTREGYCRCCHRSVPRNDEKVFLFAGYKQVIILCRQCVRDMADAL